MEIIPKIGLTVIRNGKALLVKERDWNFIGFAGGTRKPEEDDMRCLKREVKEEFGIQLKEGSVKYFGTFEDEAAGKDDIGKRVEIKLFLVEFDKEPNKTKEIEEIFWLGKDDDLIELGKVDKLIMESLIEKGLVK
jgi:8-oxo-dGTP diphosphatase